VATVHGVVKETIRAHRTLVYVFHVYASADTPWVAHALSHCTSVRYGTIASSQWHTTLLSLGIHMSRMRQYISNACSFGPNRHRRGLPPWSSKFQIRPLPFLPIQYSPFSPNCPTWSPIMPFYQLIKFSTLQSRTKV
jgi:hypothetical protein